jgi:hypothetical protein
MEVPPERLELIYQDIVLSLGYKTTVGPADKSKVERRHAGEKTELPSARLAKAAWRVAAILKPLPPPPPPTPKLAPQTYNKGSSGQDARYCTQHSGNPDGGGFRYDNDGRSLGGRSGNPVAGLKPADEMDGRGPCDPYTNNGQSFPPWPPGSYDV